MTQSQGLGLVDQMQIPISQLTKYLGGYYG